jgi:hypothetical protein
MAAKSTDKSKKFSANASQKEKCIRRGKKRPHGEMESENAKKYNVLLRHNKINYNFAA